MKRVLSIVLLVSLLMGLVGCSGQTAVKNGVISAQDVQGYWYDEDSELLMGFKGEEYILYGFGTHISVTGTFEVDDRTIIVHTEEFGDKIYESAKIEEGILSFKTPDGPITHWKNISEDEVKRMLLEDE